MAQNNKKIDFYLCLGCFGLTTDSFVSCPGIENPILEASNAIPDYQEMLDYFEQLRLYDRPLFDYNAVRHVVINLQDRYSLGGRPLWMPKKFDLYQKFVINHRHCGVYLKLRLPGEIEISAPLEIVPKKKENKLRFIRRNENG